MISLANKAFAGLDWMYAPYVEWSAGIFLYLLSSHRISPPKVTAKELTSTTRDGAGGVTVAQMAGKDERD